MRGKYFINNVFKMDSQRSAVLVANSGSVIKVVLSSAVVRCSPLNTALYDRARTMSFLKLVYLIGCNRYRRNS